MKPPKHFFIDLVILAGVVMTWRGIWHLADLYLFPNNEVLSSIISMVIGIILLYLPEEELKDLI
ncbi:hypothetical protein A2344_05325 [Candidatus Peregrinibacteria bacterium RIFOXYB12_FULL_41_12]|nr:MAG: hypothetical protein A2244_00470 [Candidatus Peregrinibacteria bacterium RIFOXYA2_FULL_41_18]OGJ48446.1 MAG: hypothetical protein A2344_05325 [Candidatus Peregrinibacteria bacterium RIFOXYB12_FULL_41_12]OGJ53727.1 MAG: hypothetical protein A2448_02110 [Candidatus Peregrinibacteria bacterium RIFOXYC2_FULL_41_22]OGJ53947.1 MAG: hypothetical protein A2336_01380 [Candidatus Peregrinibacteria bacterium RIFOXYB2_FULL_41_88]